MRTRAIQCIIIIKLQRLEEANESDTWCTGERPQISTNK